MKKKKTFSTKPSIVWERLFSWMKLHPHLARMIVILVGLFLAILILPSHIRDFFWQGLLKNGIIAGMLIGFSILTLSLVWAAGQRLDVWTFKLLNIRGKRPTWLDRLMVGFTQLGHGVTALAISLLLLLVRKNILSYKLMLGTITLWLLVEFLKLIVHRSRPFIRLTEARIVGGKAIGRSFPSGHTSQVFFTATLVIQGFQLPAIVAFALYAIAMLVGITRIYVGAHYPRDVAAGAILGSAWGLLWILIDRFAFISLT